MKRFTTRLLLISACLLALNGCVVYQDPNVPPPLVVEHFGPPPFPAAVWVRGHWVWAGPRHRWVWVHGYWR